MQDDDEEVFYYISKNDIEKLEEIIEELQSWFLQIYSNQCIQPSKEQFPEF